MNEKQLLRISLLIIFLWVLLLVSGCSSIFPERVKAPESRIISSNFEVKDPPSVEVLSYPDLPQVSKIKDFNGRSWAAFDKQGLDSLLEFRSIAETNQRSLISANKIIRDLTLERNELVNIARVEEKKYNFIAEKWAQSENELRDEKIEHTIDVWGYRVLLIFLGVLVVQDQ